MRELIETERVYVEELLSVLLVRRYTALFHHFWITREFSILMYVYMLVGIQGRDGEPRPFRAPAPHPSK